MPATLSRCAQYVRQDPPWRRPDVYRSPRFGHNISLPFAGIGGPDRALKEGKWPHRAVNVIEKRPECKEALNRIHGYEVAKIQDLTKMEDEDWEDCQGMLTGPPCIDFSFLGCKKGTAGQHGNLMEVILNRIKKQADKRRPGSKLRWVVIENVWVCTFHTNKNGCVLSWIKLWWAENMPGWTPLKVTRWDARNSGLGQRRDRMILFAFELDLFKLLMGCQNNLKLFHMRLLRTCWTTSLKVLCLANLLLPLPRLLPCRSPVAVLAVGAAAAAEVRLGVHSQSCRPRTQGIT